MQWLAPEGFEIESPTTQWGKVIVVPKKLVNIVVI